MPELSDPEDAKLLTLARSSRARAVSVQGAAVRDTDGRTYAATDVDLSSLRLGALAVAVAMAVSSGGRGLEAAVVVGDSDEWDTADMDVVRDFAGSGVPVYRAGPDAVVHETLTT